MKRYYFYCLEHKETKVRAYGTACVMVEKSSDLIANIFLYASINTSLDGYIKPRHSRLPYLQLMDQFDLTTLSLLPF